MDDDEPDIVSLGKPRRFDLPSRQPWPIATPFGRYQLAERLPAGPDDECYLARQIGPAGFEQVVFVRRFAVQRLDDAMRDAVRRQARVSMRGVSQIFELGVEGEWAYIVSELIAGASIAALARHRVSWLAALAVTFDACRRLARVHQRFPAQALELAVTPARMVLGTGGEVVLCMGPPVRHGGGWHRTLCDVIYPILALAAADEAERVLLRELFTDEHPDAVWVAADALVQRHPELDPVLPMVFLSLAGRVEPGAARAALVERVPVEDLQALWQVVVDRAVRRDP